MQSEQDRKSVFRRLVCNLGGLNNDHMRDEFKKVLAHVRPDSSIRFYNTRGCVTSDMKNSGMDSVFRRYVTGHSLAGEILADYEYQDLHFHMDRYFKFIQH